MNGMSTQVFFEQGSAQDVLVLPIEALGRRVTEEDNDAGLGYMIHLKGKKEVLVHVGLMDRTNAEIRDGLSEGDEVVITSRTPASGSGARKGQGGRGMSGPRL